MKANNEFNKTSKILTEIQEECYVITEEKENISFCPGEGKFSMK